MVVAGSKGYGVCMEHGMFTSETVQLLIRVKNTFPFCTVYAEGEITMSHVTSWMSFYGGL